MSDKNAVQDNSHELLIGSDLVKFSVILEVGGTQYEEDVNSKLSIPSPETISTKQLTNMMAEVTSIHARWNVLYYKARKQYEDLVTKSEVWYARQFTKTKRELLSKGKVTDKDANNAIIGSSDYLKWQMKISSAKENMSNIKAIADGFGRKSDKLDSIASMIKFEARLLMRRNVGEYDADSDDYDESNNDPINRPSNGWS